jgi:hypothetical protein
MSLLALNACSMKYAIFENGRKESGHAEDRWCPVDQVAAECMACIQRATGFQIKVICTSPRARRSLIHAEGSVML